MDDAGYMENIWACVREPGPDLYDPEVPSIELQNTLSKYSPMNASQISALSHADLPYRASKDNEPIKYELVFYRDPQMFVSQN